MNAIKLVFAVLVFSIVVSCVNDRDQENLNVKADSSISSKRIISISDTIQAKSQNYGDRQRAEAQADAAPADTIDPTKPKDKPW